MASGRRFDLVRKAYSGDQEKGKPWKQRNQVPCLVVTREVGVGGGSEDVFQKVFSCCLRVSFPRLTYSMKEGKKSLSRFLPLIHNGVPLNQECFFHLKI